MILTRVALLGLALTFLQTIFTVAADVIDRDVVVRRELDASGINAQGAMGIAKSCYAAFVKNIPPSFCYKSPADAGTIPTACSSGYFRYIALCYQNCQSGYYFSIGTCWESCPSGYNDDGLTCYHSFFNWFFKKSYIPSSYTNFDGRAACTAGMYKAGALCYRDCGKIGLLNCGIGACSATSASCASTIATMAIDALLAIAQTVLLVISPETSEADTVAIDEAKNAAEQGFAKLGQNTIEESASVFKTVLSREGRQAYLDQMTNYVVKNGVSWATAQGEKTVAKEVVSAVCNEIGSKLLDQVSQSSGSTLNFQSFVNNLQNTYVGSCSSISDTNSQISCASTVLNDVALVDPTGLAALAASVLQPICNGV